MNEGLRQLLPNPVETVKALDKYIIGQVHAKKALALMLFNRALTILIANGQVSTTLKPLKSNILLIGPTGTGKTSIVKALAEISDIPISFSDVTGLTKNGYVGDDLDTVLADYASNIDQYFNARKQHYINEGIAIDDDSFGELKDAACNHGIIYIDEVDKLTTIANGDKPELHSNALQNEFLKILEGGIKKVTIYGKDNKKDLVGELDTTNITFILGGAFSGLGEIIRKRLDKKMGVGFGAEIQSKVDRDSNLDHLMAFCSTEDLIEYGFKPEFLGRIPIRAVLSPLSVDMLEEIITDTKDSVLQYYKELFSILNIELHVEQEAIKAIAEHAHKLNTGARSIRALFDGIMSPYIYNIYSNTSPTLTITKEIVLERMKA